MKHVLLIGLASLVLFVVLAEIVLRVVVYREMKHGYILMQNAPDMQKIQVFDQNRLWVLTPNIRDFHVKTQYVGSKTESLSRAFTVSTNSLGLRGGPLMPKDKVVRILAVGDSTTFGLGVNNDETWPAQLEAKLNAGAGGPEYEVVNCGVVGYTAYQCLMSLRLVGFGLRPNLIIVTAGNNDWAEWARVSQMEIIRSVRRMGPFSSNCLSWQVLKLLAAGAFRGGRQPNLSPAEFSETLVAIADECKQRSIPLLFIRWPWKAEVTGEPVFNPIVQYQNVLLETAAKAGVPVVDLLETWRGKGANLYLANDPVHVGPEGCRQVADTLVDPVRGMLRTAKVSTGPSGS
jgi:lysophospholipase L1-like esterase